ncbi:hypothetical protein OH76DRAFT_461535 [Lentinus brumalis]|uniref:Uncharacterized protein n=1 Tax=Lentinus brumalis TaxID=2498619 RepID=A0A371CIE8_9APHY|nr:hypothetical protein OH76DRAFT_461535 [Polyporus brumalis]
MTTTSCLPVDGRIRGSLRTTRVSVALVLSSTVRVVTRTENRSPQDWTLSGLESTSTMQGLRQCDRHVDNFHIDVRRVGARMGGQHCVPSTQQRREDGGARSKNTPGFDTGWVQSMPSREGRAATVDGEIRRVRTSQVPAGRAGEVVGPGASLLLALESPLSDSSATDPRCKIKQVRTSRCMVSAGLGVECAVFRSSPMSSQAAEDGGALSRCAMPGDTDVYVPLLQSQVALSNSSCATAWLAIHG